MRLRDILLAGGGVALATMVGWRLLARRRSLPCPPWLSWLLENPLTNRLGGPAILDDLGLEPGMKVLDAGCGPGRLTVPAARRVGPAGEVVGLDIQPEMVRRATARVAAAGLSNVRFVQAGLGQGQLPAAAFDRALLVTVLGEIPEREAALRELYAALKPGGRLAIAEVFPDPHFQRQATVRRLAAEAGLREVTTSGSPLVYTMLLERPA
jgi:ubiquinone/menaquinone biosynthesis C-methylase UbiE